MFTEHDCGQEMTVGTVPAGFGNSHTNLGLLSTLGWVTVSNLGAIFFFF